MWNVTLGVGLGLALAGTAQAAGAADGNQPMRLDLSKLQREKFVTDGKTNASWQTVCGWQVFDGLPFLIEGRGCVYGTKMGPEKRGGTNTYPDHIGIEVGRKFDELHLLHVTQWADVEGREIARIRLNYADGTKHECPILFGGQVRDWHRMPSEEKELLTDPNTKIVWRAPGVERIKSTLRLFKTMLPNPEAEKEVTTIDVVSSKHLAAYDLIAATVANRDPGRPVTAAVPPGGGERKFDGELTVRVVERGSGKPVAGALVQPTMQVDEVSVIAIPFLTDGAGEGVLRYPVELATRVWGAVEKEGYATQSGSVELGSEPTKRLEVELRVPPKLTGVAKDGTGATLAGVEIALWPDWQANAKAVKTDAEGRFTLTWNPQDQGNTEYDIFLIARAMKENLALAQVIDEDTTNVDLQLEPALTLAGRVTDEKGKPLGKAEARVVFLTERMGAGVGKPVQAGAEGRFEIKALPAGRRYSVSVSAKGYGTASRSVDEEAEGKRIELEVCQLALADQRIAGVVVDADDKPVAGATIYGYGEGQPSVNGKTDDKGRFEFKQVCAGQIRVQANSSGGSYGSVVAEAGETNITLQLGVQENYGSGRSAVRIKGTVTDAEGKPAAKVKVSLFPNYQPGEKQTDSEGRFTLTWNPSQFGGMGESQPVVVARDLARNLAAAMELEEDATNATLKLEPGLVLAGRVTGPEAKVITNAQAQVHIRTERMSSSLGTPVKADAEGRFEIKGLPPGRQYSVVASAKGYGQEDRTVEATEGETKRVELEAFELLLADQRVAGVVLDTDDKPVARAHVYCYGEKQPGVGGQTDTKGRFTIEKVCAGPIQISANTQGSGYGNVRTEGGDTNITIRISSGGVVRRSEVRRVTLKGKPLPELAPVGLTAADAPADRVLLAVVIDAEQRPSRRALRLVGEQAGALKEKGVAVVAIQAGAMAEEAFKAWKEEAGTPFPIGCVAGDALKARAAWGVGALPWLILTDKAHKVTAEGFSLEELEAKLKDLDQ